jgi:hypothetical protein
MEKNRNHRRTKSNVQIITESYLSIVVYRATQININDDLIPWIYHVVVHILVTTS